MQYFFKINRDLANVGFTIRIYQFGTLLFLDLISNWII